MNVKNKIKETIALMAAMVLTTAVSAAEKRVQESDSVSVTRTSSEVAAYTAKSALLSIVMSTNCTAVAKVMTPPVRQDWIAFLKAMKLGDKQYFLPDFNKVLYPLIGGHDSTGCLFGYYNPFYDAFMLFIVDNKEKASISGFRFIWTNQLLEKDVKKDFLPPLATGVQPCTDYFKVMLAEMSFARTSFHGAFTDSQFRRRFAALPLKDPQTLHVMQEILRKRIGQVVGMSERPEFSKIVLARAILEKGEPGGIPFLAQDGSTAKVLSTLSREASPLRRNFTVAAYFVEGEQSNFIFSNRQMQSLMVQAMVDKGKKVHLRMFDMSQVGAGK